MKKTFQKSSYGFSVSDGRFVGLPSTGLRGKWIQIIVYPNGPATIAPIGHIGPWNGGGWNKKYDDPYWKNRKRPQAESGKDLQGRKTNRAGLVISPKLWKEMGLGQRKRIKVRWQFVATPRNKKIIVVKNNKRSHFKN